MKKTVKYRYLINCFFLEKYLFKESKFGALVSGFGHNETIDRHLETNELSLSKNLHHVLLKVENHEKYPYPTIISLIIVY